MERFIGKQPELSWIKYADYQDLELFMKRAEYKALLLNGMKRATPFYMEPITKDQLNWIEDQADIAYPDTIQFRIKH